MAMMVPLPSYSGKRLVNARAPVSRLGCSDHSGNAIADSAEDSSADSDDEDVGCVEAAASILILSILGLRRFGPN